MTKVLNEFNFYQTKKMGPYPCTFSMGLAIVFTLYVLVVFDNPMTTVGDSDCFYLQQDVITGWVDGLKKTTR